MDQFQWRQLTTGSLAARILDSFLEGDTIKLNIQVREVSLNNLAVEPSLKTNLTKSHSILFDIVRSLPELAQLNSCLSKLDGLNCLTDHDEKLAKSVEIATQILDSLVVTIGQDSLSSEILEFFKQDYNAVSRIKHNLEQTPDTWTSKLIRRISQRSNNLVEPVAMNRSKSDNPSESDPIPLLKRSFTVTGRSNSLLRRVTLRSKKSVEEETKSPSLMRQPSKLLSRFNSYRENSEKSKHRPSVSRSLTTRPRSIVKTTPKPRPNQPLLRSGTLRDRLTRKKTELDPSAIEITILLPNLSNSEIKLTVSQDITYDKLVRGLRNKVILSGVSLPTPECLQLHYFRSSISIPLCTENLIDFFTSPEVEKQVLVSVDTRLSPANRVSWLDLNSPSLISPNQYPHTRQLSTHYTGLLDLDSPGKLPKQTSPIFKMDRDFEMANIDDYLRTPCKTEAQNIMSDKLWGTMPQLQFSVPSSAASSTASSPQKSPELPILDDNFTSEPDSMLENSSPPSPPSLPQRQNTMRSLLSRKNSTISAIIDGIPNQLLKLKSHNSLRRSPLQTNSVPVRSISNYFPSRLKVTVAINGEFVVKLDLEPRTATFTSLHNRITTKFSRGGYPLAKLNNMVLVYCHLSQPSFAPESTLTIQDTPTLHRIMSLTCQSNQPILHLLMIPNSLLTMDTQVNRKGMRWEAPPNLVKVGRLANAVKS